MICLVESFRSRQFTDNGVHHTAACISPHTLSHPFIHLFVSQFPTHETTGDL